jgi:outer membrane protein TolC
MRFRHLAFLLGLFAAVEARAQMGAPQLPPQASMPVSGPSAPGLSASGQNPFLGGVPEGRATAEAIPLSLSDAITRGLKYNLGSILGEQASRAALGARWRALSNLLPNVTTRVSGSSQQVNLAAFGFSGLPGVPMIVGPFEVFDVRASLSQEVLNFTSIFNSRAAGENLRAANFSLQDARETIVLVVANLYLSALAGTARVDAAQAQLNTAEAVYRRALDMKNAGVVAGIDVLQAQVERDAEKQRVIFFRNEFEKQKLSLARAIGLPVGQTFTLADKAPYAPLPALTLEQAVGQAYASRADFQSARAAVNAAEALKRAAESERLPNITLDANYGTIGPSPVTSHGTYAVAGTLNFPIFQGGRVRGDILQADARLRQRRAELEDLRTSIDYEIRTAFLDIKAAGDQVEVARGSIDLANQQLRQSQDRFSAGVANNLEVVQAQQAVATANENYISSLYAYNVAKASLARAIGGAEKNWKLFLGGQ